ncbi:hypothetical protein C7T94_16270 [Pedobacter yulinensis]|uniref:Alpha/beta hydrolase n=1 Tax=Pedobacter yulinensis TaxID=2126353 RepID=A0A2T3HIR3_9SPHI|nr:hypothetical protein [Pedobacter yulinensis]PST82335.1 hypothetical protein C7T94_16270 [Pedobacter yulinensis]
MKDMILKLLLVAIIASACKKKSVQDGTPAPEGLTQLTETANGITYRLITPIETQHLKGILVIGSGNDENNPGPGALDGAAENAVCQKAAAAGYAAAIVAYRSGRGMGWNDRATQMGQDFDRCISALAQKYGIPKSRSVAGGFSYTSYMLLTEISAGNSLNYCQGLLAACGSAGAWNAQNFKIPIYSITCSGGADGAYAGQALYDQIPVNSPVKGKSAGLTDTTCSTHCGGNWTDLLVAQTKAWLP